MGTQTLTTTSGYQNTSIGTAIWSGSNSLNWTFPWNTAETSHLRVFNGIGFSLPASLIKGISVTVTYYNYSGSTLGCSLYNGSSTTVDERIGSNKTTTADTSGSTVSFTFGSGSDLWGTSGLTDSDINNSNFGIAVYFAATITDAASSAITNISITITYSQTIHISFGVNEALVITGNTKIKSNIILAFNETTTINIVRQVSKSVCMIMCGL